MDDPLGIKIAKSVGARDFLRNKIVWSYLTGAENAHLLSQNKVTETMGHGDSPALHRSFSELENALLHGESHMFDREGSITELIAATFRREWAKDSFIGWSENQWWWKDPDFGICEEGCGSHS